MRPPEEWQVIVAGIWRVARAKNYGKKRIDRGEEMDLQVVGVVRSPLKRREDCPKQGNEGAPEAWIEIDERFTDSIEGLKAGDRVILVTWLHQGRRETQQVYPRRNRASGLYGVFATRSPDRPNPIGLHEVEILEIVATRIRVKPLEVVDGTPVVDIKPVLC